MKYLPVALLALILLAIASLLIGVSDVSLAALFADNANSRAKQILLISRLPRTLALVLAGSSMAIAGLIMQMLVRNRFVEPATAGTLESASLGLLVITLFAPGLALMGKMLVSALFALFGTLLFLRILRQVPLRDILLVPLIGIMLGGIISAVTTFFAYRYDLLQSLLAFRSGDFSGVLSGRYELLWLGFLFALAAWFLADRLTVAGMGEDFTTNLGLNYRHTVTLGLIIVSLVSASVVVTVGMIPFLGLLVPNIVSLIMGDNMRRAIPWVALLGSFFVLLCDMIGRTIRAPYEIPIGTVVGVVGSALFLYLLLRKSAHAS
ncbi:iron ABC transporter permease [Ventosimonas gracilis]|uniref:Iron ABC transporter permease n=1 Tax=Ventosimonas gracilis TaxID=1680762 RepID=A0A139SH94_9GAMM|nr:ABC transporter permease [Ventosimonas gracilis]KXU33935.1 iron ABC transporter permease [Ventosimonas gracilis]